MACLETREGKPSIVFNRLLIKKKKKKLAQEPAHSVVEPLKCTWSFGM